MEASVLPIQSPQLLHRSVQGVVAILRNNLPWLTHPYGVVETVVDEQDRKVRYPAIYRQDSTKYYQTALPNEKTMSALSFFEKNGESRIVWDAGSPQLMGSWRHPVNLAVWCNLPKIDNRGYDFSGELAADVLRVLRLYQIPFDTLDLRIERVFERYALKEKKLLFYPFAGFKIPLVLTERYDACATPFQRRDPSVEYLQASAYDQFLSTI